MAFTVRKWRLANELSQEKMAELLGVHVNTYIGWEKHPEKITVGNGIKIARIFGVSLNDIIFLPSTLQNVENDVGKM